MNKFIGTGNLVRDPELKFTPGTGTAVCTFTIASTTGYGDKKETAYIPVVVWGKNGENMVNYIRKGSKVLVQGRINTRSYDGKDGHKVYVTEIIADTYNGVEFLDNKNNQVNGNNTQDYGSDITPVDDGSIPF